VPYGPYFFFLLSSVFVFCFWGVFVRFSTRDKGISKTPLKALWGKSMPKTLFLPKNQIVPVPENPFSVFLSFFSFGFVYRVFGRFSA
jgi:hypothetical protein